MARHDIVREKLLDLLQGGDAHMDFEEAVQGFPEDKLNARPENMPYSAWHILEHMRIAQWDILEFIRNPDHVSPDYPEGYRPRAEQAANMTLWRESVASFRKDRQALQGLVADPKIDLLAPLSHAPAYTIFREILVISDHTAYHIGEIALLRQILGAWPPERPYLTG